MAKKEAPLVNNTSLPTNEDVANNEIKNKLENETLPEIETGTEKNILPNVKKIVEEVNVTNTIENNKENKPSFKILNTQSNAVIIPTLIDLESKIELDESINEAQQKIEDQLEKEKPQIVLQPNEVQESLTAYATMLKAQSKNVLGSLVNMVQFTINGPLVQMLVDSKVKAQQLSGIKENLLIHLKKELQQSEVQLKIGFIERSKTDTTPTKAYSPKERLNEMMQENPNVKDLIEKLDLNFEL